MTEIRSFCADIVCDIEIDINSALVCNSRKMKHTVCGASKSHIGSKSVPECLFRHDIKRTDILSVKLHNLHTSHFCKLDSFGIYGGNSSVAFKSHAENFGKAVH